MIPPSCHVVRDSTIKTIPAADLVKGDIVLLVSSITLSLWPPNPIDNTSEEWGQDPG